MDKNLKVLKEVCKGVTMGMEAISYVSDKCEDEEFKNVLNHDYSMYNNILDKVNDAYSNYGEEPDNASIKDKAMLWYGIQLNTIKDSTSSKLAELLMQGTNMGIIEGRRLLNHNENLDTDVNKLLNDFVNFQEEKVEKLKKFL